MKQFKKGERVQHVTGGPRMVVVSVQKRDEESHYTCRWWHQDMSERNESRFKTDAFIAIELDAVKG